MLFLRAISKAMITQEPLETTGRHGTRSLGRGSIVNLASGFSYVASAGIMPYVTAKHAVMGLTKAAGKLSDPS